MKFYPILLLGVILWGLYPIFTHHFVLTLDPLFLVSIASFVASIPFIIRLIITGKQNQLFSGKNLKSILPVALFTGASYSLLFIGTKLTSGTNSGLLLQAEPIYALILGVIFFGEVLGKERISASLVLILGAMIIVYKGGANPNLGDLLILLVPLSAQISHTIAKKLLDKGMDKYLLLAGRQFYSGLLLIVFVFTMNKSFFGLLSFNNLAIASYLGLYISAVIFIWYTSIKKMPVSVASSYLPITALASLLGSAFFLKETISTQQYVGFFFIVGGMIWLGKLYSRKTAKG
jgi:drug/metabolite transporter (DMT)-like permease